MRPRLGILVVMLLLCRSAAASGLYEEINRLRAGEGACARADAGAAKPRPLTAQSTLEAAAKASSAGKSPPESIKASGYRDTRYLLITVSVTGGGGERQMLATLGAQFCEQLRAPDFSDIGVYETDDYAWIILAAPFAPRVADSKAQAAQKILELVNKARATSRPCGDKRFTAARPLTWNETLARAAAAHAEDMARHNYFTHEGRDGSTPAERVTQAGYAYRATGENMAGGQMAPEDAVAGWIKSPPHCANLMGTQYTEMGAAFAINQASEMGVYWVQEFGAPR